MLSALWTAADKPADRTQDQGRNRGHVAISAEYAHFTGSAHAAHHGANTPKAAEREAPHRDEDTYFAADRGRRMEEYVWTGFSYERDGLGRGLWRQLGRQAAVEHRLPNGTLDVLRERPADRESQQPRHHTGER